MANYGTATSPIRNACRSTVQVYQLCIPKASNDESYNLIKTEYDRLKIWAGNMGVYARSPASADDRLANDDELRNIVIDLLAKLTQRLQAYVDMCEDGNSIESSITSDSSTSSAEGNQQALMIPSVDFNLLRCLRRYTSQLFSVLALVRYPTNLSSNEKVFTYDFRSKLSDGFDELITDFAGFFEFYLRMNFKSTSQVDQCSISETPLANLKNAAVIRRKALLLKGWHRRKLRGNISAEFADMPVRSANVTAPGPIGNELKNLTSDVAVPRSEAGHTVLSGTVLSLVPKPPKDIGEKPKVQDAPKSSKSMILLRGSLDIPQPPKCSKSQSEVNCYICGLSLNETKLESDGWKKHVLEDVDPFVCLFNCNKPDVLYKTPEEWYKHMQMHRMEWCCMVPAHRHLKFNSEADLAEHLRNFHASKLSQAQINLLLKRGTRKLPNMFEDCPLCGRTPLEIESVVKSDNSALSLDRETATRILHRHLERHMYELALLSLPPYEDLVAMSRSAAMTEASDDKRAEIKGQDLAGGGLECLPRDVEEPQQNSVYYRDLDEVLRWNRVPDDFFDGEQARDQIWAEFVANQHNPTDLEDDAHWQTICESLMRRKYEEYDSSWPTSDPRSRAEFRSQFVLRSGCPEQAQLQLCVSEKLCTNVQIYEALHDEAVNIVDITISPPADDGERTVTIFLSSLEASEEALKDLDDFHISGVKVAIRRNETIQISKVDNLPIYLRSELLNEDFHIGWICTLQIELIAARAVLEEEYDMLTNISVPKDDRRLYVFGRVRNHRVVLACLSSLRNDSAGAVVERMLRTFTNIRGWLLVGIGSGIPDIERGVDIRLGDVVVGVPDGLHGGVVQYDLGKTSKEGFPTSMFHSQPLPSLMRFAISRIQTVHQLLGSKIGLLSATVRQTQRLAQEDYSYPGGENDVLHCANIRKHQGLVTCARCHEGIVARKSRNQPNPVIHYGVIGSSNVMVKDAMLRDLLGQKLQIKCLEVDPIGLIERLPYLAIRGICDYADAFKDTVWQKYAAATAAEFARELLQCIEPDEATTQQSTDIKKITWQTLTQWLQPPEYMIPFEDVLHMRSRGTGLWLLNNQVYQTWKASDHSLLWLHGIVGCGKTFLSATALEDINTKSYDRLGTMVGFYYFSEARVRENSLHCAIKSLLGQFAAQYPGDLADLARPHELSIILQSPPNLKQLRSLLDAIIEHNSQKYILFDGIDECSDRDELILFLKDLMKSPTSRVCLLLTSRQMCNINLVTAQDQCHVIEVRGAGINGDISLYVERILGDDDEMPIWPADVIPEIFDELPHKANGMFLWARCLLESLRDCLTLTEMKEELLMVPPLLADTYGRILNEIPTTGLTILRWLSYSYEALGPSEVMSISANDASRVGTSRARSEYQLRHPNDIISACSGLLKYGTAKHSTYPSQYQPVRPVATEESSSSSDEKVVIELGHPSMKRYMLGKECILRPQFDPKSCHMLIAQHCMYYLQRIDPENVSMQISNAEITRKYPLAVYAARYWWKHAKNVGELWPLSFVNLVYGFLSNQASILTWTRLYDVLHEDELAKAFEVSVGTPILYAAALGFREVVQFTLNKAADGRDDPIMQEAKNFRVLSFAALSGHNEIVQLLLDVGADAYPRGVAYELTPLSAASFRGHERIVQLFLEAAAGTGLHVTNCKSFALVAASRAGHANVVRQLIDAGVDVDVEVDVFRESRSTALAAASFGGHEKVVEMLINAGADLNAVGGDMSTALSVASRRGHKNVVQMLLDAGADVNAVNGGKGTALTAASSRGHEKAVEMLINAGADVNAVGGRMGTVLKAASSRGHKKVVQMLLDAGADVNVIEGGMGTALMAASFGGYEKVVQMLLDAGAEVNAVDGGMSTALMAASFGGHEKVVQMLLDAGADINAVALKAASLGGHEKVIQILRDAGAKA